MSFLSAEISGKVSGIKKVGGWLKDVVNLVEVIDEGQVGVEWGKEWKIVGNVKKNWRKFWNLEKFPLKN